MYYLSITKSIQENKGLKCEQGRTGTCEQNTDESNVNVNKRIRGDFGTGTKIDKQTRWEYRFTQYCVFVRS